MNPNSILLLLNIVDKAAMGVQMAADVRARFDATSAKVKQMVAEDRDPTPEEWALLDNETNELMNQITGETS